MSRRRWHRRTLALLIAVSVAAADPFAPVENPGEAEVSAPAAPVPAPPPDYRVAGVAISESRAVAAIRLPQGRFVIVRPGESVGDASVVEITLDAVHLETSAGVLRLPVSD